MDDRPFADPRNVATITVRQIVDDGAPVLHVTHDDDDGSWQFLTGDTARMDDALVVGLGSMVDRKSTLMELADLPLGWHATHERVGGPWTRTPRVEAQE